MKRVLGAWVVILAMGLAVMAPASAAQLVLTGGQHPSYVTSTRCDDAVAVTTPSTSGTSSSVQVSGVAAECTGTLSVRVYDSTGVTRATGSAMLTGGGSQTLTTAAYAPNATDKVSVTIASWPVAATWTYTPAPTYPTCSVYRIVNGVDTPQPGKSCTVSTAISGKLWTTSGGRSANVDIVFAYSGASFPDYFRFTVDLRTAGLPADWSWTTSGTSGGNLLLASSYRCSSLPILTGSSDPGWGPTGSLQFRLDETRGAGATCAP